MITVSSLIYYPIKACRGFEVDSSCVSRMGLEHDRRMMVGRHAHGDHVVLDELAVLNTGVEAALDQVEPIVVRRDVQHNVGVFARKSAQRRPSDRR